VEIRDVKIENQSIDKKDFKLSSNLNFILCFFAIDVPSQRKNTKGFLEPSLHTASKLVLIISRIRKAKATSFTKCKRLEKKPYLFYNINFI
jgi:hypothetical protein